MSAFACIKLFEFMESVSAHLGQSSHHLQRVILVENIRLCHIDAGVGIGTPHIRLARKSEGFASKIVVSVLFVNRIERVFVVEERQILPFFPLMHRSARVAIC